MATISKESLAQFWLHAFPIGTNYDYLSFSDATIVQQLLEFGSEKKIFDRINEDIQQTKPRKIIRTTAIQTSPKRRRSVKNTLTNIDPSRLRFTVNIEVIENLDHADDIPTTAATKTEGMN